VETGAKRQQPKSTNSPKSDLRELRESLFLINLLEFSQRMDWKPQGPSEVKPHPAGPAKAVTLSQRHEALQLWKGNIRKVQGKDKGFETFVRSPEIED
jgi:hypothetical protein